jgi:hypothetical protein
MRAARRKGDRELIRIRARAALLALCVVMLAIPAALAGCGGDGGGGGEDPAEVLEQTFNNPEQITSGQVDISLDGSAEGTQSGSLTATIEGPFQLDEDDQTALPQLDLSAHVSSSGAGQTFDFDGGLIATQDNAFVEYQGEVYEVGSSLFQQFRTRYEQLVRRSQAQQGDRSPSSVFDRLGIDPQSWLTNLSNEGDEDVEGAETVHIHGDADVEQIFSDVTKVAEQVPGASASTIDPSQLDQVKSAVQEASLDVYSGKDDHILRKLGVSLAIEPPASAEGGSVTSVNIDFTLTLSEVNEAPTISAPSGAKPISGLLEQLGLSGLDPFGSAGGSVGGGGGPSPAYLDCIQNNPSDPGKCVSEL